MKSFWSLNKTGRLLGLAILSTAFVACGGGEDGLDGTDGTTALISTADASAEECAYGGTVISVGIDTNDDGELDADEVTSTTIVCDGAPGGSGNDGERGPIGGDGDDGDDGDVPLVEFSDEPVGENCSLGGVRIDTGVDADGDGELSEDEITDITYVCSSTCEGGAIDLAFGDGDGDGPVYNNIDTVTFPITTTETNLNVSFYGATEGFEFDLDIDLSEGLMVSPRAGEGTLEFVAIITNGCGLFAQALRVEEIQDGESTVYLGHFFSGAGEVDVNLAGTDTTIATFDFTDVLGPLPVVSNRYTFDIVAGGVVAGTTPELVLLPGETYVVYAYDDGGDLALGAQGIDTSAPADGNVHTRFTHLGSGVNAVDGWLIDLEGDAVQVFEQLAFGESTDLTPIAGAEDNYFVLDANGNGEPDFTFFGTYGAFAAGGILDGFVFLDGDGTPWVAGIEYLSGSSILAEANAPPELSASPNTVLASNSSTTDRVVSFGCDEVVGITMDIAITSDPNAAANVWENELTVSLVAPDGEEVLLWNRGGQGSGTNGLTGNFNETLAPSGENAEPIANLVGVNGNGDWAVTVATSYRAIFNSWTLNLECE